MQTLSKAVSQAQFLKLFLRLLSQAPKDQFGIDWLP